MKPSKIIDTFEMYQVPIEWTSLSSIIRGKALIGYLPRVCYIPRVVDDMAVSQISWVHCTTYAQCKTIRIAVSTVKDSWVVLHRLRPYVSDKQHGLVNLLT